LIGPDYELLEKIGSGAYGEVVKARHIKSGQFVAIKLLKNFMSNYYELKKILREIVIMKHFSAVPWNTHTVKLLQLICPSNLQKQPYLFLVMEYLPTDLKSVFAQEPKCLVTKQHMLLIFYNLLCSLSFIHSANIMHRDIKPANILVDSECNVKICDFGLARTNLSSFQPVAEKSMLLPEF
jgi:mitogen-activated protein kinase 1/3